MKPTALILCLIPTVLVLLNAPTSEATAPEKLLRKGSFVPYTGHQQDWPRSNVSVTPTETGRAGIVVYEQLPDRPYEIVGTVSSSGDLFVKHAALATATAGADAIIVLGDKAFTDAGIEIQPHWFKNKEVLDPNAPPPDPHRLDHPDHINRPDSPSTIRVNELTGIAIRWKHQ
jgi:hypothetical protein